MDRAKPNVQSKFQAEQSARDLDIESRAGIKHEAGCKACMIVMAKYEIKVSLDCQSPRATNLGC